MKEFDKEQITKISKSFASGFKPEISKIAGSGWQIVDPLSAFLNARGFENTLKQLPQTNKHPQILIIEFKDGTKFIPAGSDLPDEGTKDWMWIDPQENATT